MRLSLPTLTLACSLLSASATLAQSLPLAANLTVNGGPLGVASTGTTAYLANFGDNSLQTYNLAAPSAPVLLSTISPASARARSVAASGTMVYVLGNDLGTSTSSQLRAFDVSVPTAPTPRQVLTLAAPPLYVAASSTLVCVASGQSATLQVYSSDLTLLSTITTSSFADRVTLNGTTAYLQRGSQVDVYNLSTPSAPVRQTTITGTIGAVSGTLAFGLSGSTLLVYNVSNPLAPTLVGSTATNGGTLLAASGNTVFTTGLYAAIGGSTSLLQSFDVSNPSAPVLRATAGAGSTATALAASSNAAYLVNGYTLQVYSLTGSSLATLPINTRNISLYPNPARTTLTITQVAANTPVTIYDLAGRVCLHALLPASGSLDINSLSTGFYLAHIGESVQKFIVE